MGELGAVASGFGTLIVVIALGYALAKTKVFDQRAADVLTRTCFLVAAPALLFSTLARANVREVLSTPLAVTAASTAAVALSYLALARFAWRKPADFSLIGAMGASYVNAAYLGIPIAAYVLGDAAYAAPAMVFQMGVFSPVGLATLDLLRGRDRLNWTRAVLRPFANPMTDAALLGVVFSLAGWRLPEPVEAPITLVGGLAVPAILLAFGISLKGAPLPGRRDAGPMWVATAMKSLVHPALAWALGAFAFGLTGLPLAAVTITAALPCAQNVFVYATHYGAAVRQTREVVVTTTMAAAPVILVIAALLM